MESSGFLLPRNELFRVVKQSAGLGQLALDSFLLGTAESRIAELPFEHLDAIGQLVLGLPDFLDVVPRGAVRLALDHFTAEFALRGIEVAVGEVLLRRHTR